jgi:hypothetical protein
VEKDGQAIVLLKASTDCKVDPLRAMSRMLAGMGAQQKLAGKYKMSLSMAFQIRGQIVPVSSDTARGSGS